MKNNLKVNKILIYGAGTQGSIFAYLLHENGFNVNILARKQRLADIKDKGIILEDSQSKERIVSHVPPYSELYGHEAEECGQNQKILDAVGTLLAYCPKGAITVMDRGCDRNIIIGGLLGKAA